MVGAERFELPTLCSQSRCATRLRYAPTLVIIAPEAPNLKSQSRSPDALSELPKSRLGRARRKRAISNEKGREGSSLKENLAWRKVVGVQTSSQIQSLQRSGDRRTIGKVP